MIILFCKTEIAKIKMIIFSFDISYIWYTYEYFLSVF